MSDKQQLNSKNIYLYIKFHYRIKPYPFVRDQFYFSNVIFLMVTPLSVESLQK